MNTGNPILKKTIDITLPDNISAYIEGTVYDEPIWKTGELVHNMVKIVRKDNKALWGLAFYRDPMGEGELADKLMEIAENPKTIQI